MPLEIPAGQISCAWKQRVDAGLRLRGIKEKFCLAILLRDRVIAGDRDLSVGTAIRGDAIAEHAVVHNVCQDRETERGRKANYDHALQNMFESGSQVYAHGEQL